MTKTEMQQLPFDVETTPFVALEHLKDAAYWTELLNDPDRDYAPRATSDEGICYLRGYHDYVEGEGWCGPDSGGMEATCSLCGHHVSCTLY